MSSMPLVSSNRLAITREVSASLADCQLSFVSRTGIDLALARAQHQAYCDALSALGCEVRTLPALDTLPDAVFVEDVALVLDEVAVLTRPGTPSRRAEVEPMAAELAGVRPLLRIGDAAIHPDCFPRTRERLERAGIAVSAVDVSELQKAEGAVTCCSLVFEA